MKRVLFASCSIILGLAATQSYAAQNCQHPYNKVLPYDLPLGAEKASVLLHADVRFTYDCASASAEGSADATASFMNLDLNLLTANALAATYLNSSDTNGSIGQARVVVLGKEVVNEGLDLESLVDFDPSQDIDVSDTIYFNVGPVPVPVNYGVEGTTGVHVKGGIQSVGVGLNVNPHVQSHAYVQAGVSGKIAQAFVRGDLTVLNDELKNLLHYGVYDNDVAPELRFAATSSNQYTALEGEVYLKAKAMMLTYNKTLFNWPGVTNDAVLFDFTKNIALLQ